MNHKELFLSYGHIIDCSVTHWAEDISVSSTHRADTHREGVEEEEDE